MKSLDKIFGGQLGIVIAFTIIIAWSCHLVFSLLVEGSLLWYIPIILIQTHLYTGIFITAHDAMHGTVSRSKNINTIIGWICSLIFAFNFYPKLIRKHHAHHLHVVTEDDPDYHKGGFARWYFSFLREYVTLPQILLMAATFNFFIWVVGLGEVKLLLFWILPSILSTLQLFYFGTYQPHKGPHDPGNIHKANSQRKNHFLAFLTCYFFGYHYEHHDSPGTPWWLLYSLKN